MTYYGQGLGDIAGAIGKVAKSIDKLSDAAITAATAYSDSVGRKGESIVYNITVEARTGASAHDLADQIKQAARSARR